MAVANMGRSKFLHQGLHVPDIAKAFPPLALVVARATGKRPMVPKASKRKRGK